MKLRVSSIGFALLLGYLLGIHSQGTSSLLENTAMAAPRPTLKSLQNQIVALTQRVTAAETGVASMQTSIAALSSELSTPGELNSVDNPVDWTRLKNVPPALADGDNVGVTGAGNGLQLIGDTISIDFGVLDQRYVRQ